MKAYLYSNGFLSLPTPLVYYLCNFFSTNTLEIKKRKKKKKKNPVPKDFKAGFVPDPERWTPLRER